MTPLGVSYAANSQVNAKVYIRRVLTRKRVTLNRIVDAPRVCHWTRAGRQNIVQWLLYTVNTGRSHFACDENVQKPPEYKVLSDQYNFVWSRFSRYWTKVLEILDKFHFVLTGAWRYWTSFSRSLAGFTLYLSGISLYLSNITLYLSNASLNRG